MTTFKEPLEKRFEAKLRDMARRLAATEQQLTNLTFGAVACTSTTHPANPATGMEIFETDTGLEACWSGSVWLYRPQLITKTVLGSPASSVVLPSSGSIPQVFTHLRLVICARSSGTGASGYDAANLQLNGVTSASYNWSTWWVPQGGTSVSTTGGTAATSAQCAEIWNSHFSAAGGRGIATLEFPNYSDAAAGKLFTSAASATDGGAAGIQQAYSGALSASVSTAAITSITLLMSTGNFLAGSSFSLYGY